jgi:hypothetical protein
MRHAPRCGPEAVDILEIGGLIQKRLVFGLTQYNRQESVTGEANGPLECDRRKAHHNCPADRFGPVLDQNQHVDRRVCRLGGG